MKNALIFTVIGLMICTTEVWAQEGSAVSESPLITDRPTQTYSSFVLPKGVFQIESGVGYAKSIFPGSPADLVAENYTLNFLQLRYGLSNKVELRLAQNVFFNRTKIGSLTNRGEVKFASTWIGTKIKVLDEDGAVPQASLVAEYVADIFDETTGQDLMNLRLNFSNTLSDKFTLGYGLGGFVPLKNGPFDFQYSVVGSYGFSKGWGAFLELYGTFRNDLVNSHNVDLGFTYLVNNNLQLDAYTGFDLTNNFDDTDFIFGFGFSTRILKK